MRNIWIKRVLTMVLCAFLTCITVSAADTVYEKTTLPTLQEFLQVAIQPVGKTIYVWGGGWNEADTAAGIEAISIGTSPQWERFFTKQSYKYNFNTTLFQIHNGLDCSGYVGWAIYNIFNTENGNDGYVMKASKMAKDFAERGWGSYTTAKNVKKYTPGSIMSSKGHVYIVLGQCSDGSVVLVHSSPPGVQISGTVSTKANKSSQAISLATKYMKKYYPEWYKKYPANSREKSYLTDYNQMTWKLSGNSVLSDPDGISKMSASQVLTLLYGKKL